MNEASLKETNTELFSNKELIVISLIFIGIWVGINIFFRFISSFFNVGINTLWPVGKVRFMVPFVLEIIIGASIFSAFLIILRFYSKYRFNLMSIIIIGMALIISTNLIHGLWKGFVSPTEGSGGMTYYWDAIEIEDVYDFISNYERNQEKLELHSRTHPPGAVLFYFFLYKIFVFSALISIAVCVISTVFSAYFLNAIIKREINEDISLYITFLFLLIPAIQIYYLANLYAVVSTLIIGVIYFYRYPKYKISLIGTIIFLFLIASLTFMVVFILGVLFCFEFFKSYRNKSIKNFQKLYTVYLCLFLIFVIVLVGFRFNYINSFLYAGREENPYGFRLFVNPYDYFITRMENILEILILFGPFLIILFIRGFPIMKKEYNDFYLLTISAFIVLLALFLAGVYRTGETARACSYIYPFLIFPIAIYFNKIDFPQIEKNKLLILIFAQTIIMQSIGYYKW
jgi:hypothetical protein